MADYFWPRSAAVDFNALCAKWSPGTGSAALFYFQASLPGMAESAWMVAAGWNQVAVRSAAHLSGGLKPEMARVLADIYQLSAKAAQLAGTLQSQFLKIHAEDVRRAETRGAHTANVPVGGRI